MKTSIWMRFLALFLLLVLVVGIVPAAFASESASAEEASPEEIVEGSNDEPDTPQISPPAAEPEVTESDTQAAPAESDGEDSPLSDDGETLTRDESLFATAAASGPRRARLLTATAGSTGTMSKSTCVEFSDYSSPTWYCNRYYSEGSHVYGHYFYASTIAYHTIDGTWAYCIEPNTSSLGGQSYKSYAAGSASDTSYWMRELDSTQRHNIQLILAYGYPEADYGYGQQAQYAATQTLIWEVACKVRYSDIKTTSDSGLYSKVKAVLGDSYASAYSAIVSTISESDGTVPSFSGSDSAQAITLELNKSTNCYEASVTDSNGVLSHFTFALEGVTFTKDGNTLKISVPAGNTTAKGQTITGVSDQKDMSTSNPLVWENSTYQTVATAGGAESVYAYIKLDWMEAPTVGNLEVSKAVNYGTWTGFTFRLHGTSDAGNAVDMTAKTGDDGKAYFKDVEIGTYTLEEVSPGGQYITPQSQTVTIPGDSTAKVTMTNYWKHWQATITKVDADTTTAQGDGSLEDAEYTLYKSGKAVATYTVKNGGFVTDSLPCTENDGVYTLKETKAPTGYKLNETVYPLTTSYSHYTELDNSIAVTVSDTVIQGRIKLEKKAVNTVSSKKVSEVGATYQVWLKSAGSFNAAKESERDTVTIVENGSGTSKYLPYGVYYVQQTSGWEGYSLDETIYEVSIKRDGTTVNRDANGKELAFENNIWTGSISILKVDGDTKEPLAGAEFTLTGTDGSSTVLTTGEDGKVTFPDLVYGVEYIWTETKAPHGYVLSEENTGKWNVSKAEDTLEVTCSNTRRPGSITVTKMNTAGDKLFGAAFKLEYLDGETWKTVSSSKSLTRGGCTTAGLTDGVLTTGEDGTVTFDGLWADDAIQYRLTEVRSPEGYELLSEPVFEGTLPVSATASKVSFTPDEVDGTTGYYYNLPVTVQEGRVYTLPKTGGRNLPLFLGIAGILLMGTGLCMVTLGRKSHN